MKMKCLDSMNSGYELTKDKIYEITKEDEFYYWTINDNGEFTYFNKDRFKIIKEDKKMKEYKLQEVIANIEDGEEYKSDSPLWEIKSIKKVNGNINFIYNGVKNDSVGVNANQRFIKVETPVSFIDVLNSGKKCRVEHELIDKIQLADDEENDFDFNEYMEVDEVLFEITNKYEARETRYILLNGRWYLEN